MTWAPSDGAPATPLAPRQESHVVPESTLLIPNVDIAAEAGRLLERLPIRPIWASAWSIPTTTLDAVHVDTVEEKRKVAIRPKPAFRPLFEIANEREGSGVVLSHEPEAKPVAADQHSPRGQEADADSCSWWRRWRVELPLKHKPAVLLAVA